MTATYFIDTNILLYVASKADDDQAKREVARELLRRPEIGFSAQVRQEFYSASISKKRLLMTHDEAVAILPSLAVFPVYPITRELVLQAISTKTRFGISYWDAAIVAASKLLGCGALYSEDLNAGLNYDGVTVVNPFANLTADRN